MSLIECPSCKSKQEKTSNFCSSCGNRLKCSNCNEAVNPLDKFCSNCGQTIIIESTNTDAPNTIKFKETKDERSYELAFTDEVSKEVTNLVTGMMKGKPVMLNSGGNFSFEELDDSNNDEIDNIDKDKNEKDKLIDIDDNYPHINDLEMKMTFSEKEWIIIYSFYKSNFGKAIFKKDDVRDLYKEKRDSGSRMPNFFKNWNSSYQICFRTQREGELKFTDEGLKFVKSLLTGEIKTSAKKTSVTKTNTTNKTKKKSAHKSSKGKEKSTSKVIPKSVAIEKFDINSKKISLEKFLESIGSPKSTNEIVLAIGYYIIEICGSSSFSDGNVDFAYKVLKLDNRPTLLRQTISNVKNRDFWIEKAEGKSWKLSRIGELHIEKLKSFK